MSPWEVARGFFSDFSQQFFQLENSLANQSLVGWIKNEDVIFLGKSQKNNFIHKKKKLPRNGNKN